MSKETICKKCGEAYDANYKACPNCGFNPFRHYLKVAGIVALTAVIVTNFILSIVIIVRQSDLMNRVDQINISAGAGSVAQNSSVQTDITNYTFYDDYLLGENAILDNLGNDYFLYYHSESCQYCLEANNLILSYYNIPVSKNSKDYIYDIKPVYFITTEYNEALFDQFNVESTPTMIHMVNGAEESRAIGVEEINSMFEKVVKEYYPN